MENSSKSITMAEKRVGEMNKLTQGFLEQSNRCLRQMEQTQSAQDKQFQNRTAAPPRQNVQQNMPQNVPNRNNTVHNSMPNSQLQRRNVPFQNNGQPQKPRFESIGNARQRKPQPFAPPEPPIEPQVQTCPQEQSSGISQTLLPVKLDPDTMLIAVLAAVLVREKADTKLILALLYILF